MDRDASRIGRGADNDIQIEAGSASTNHCVMKRVPGGFILEDLGSTNGIKLGDTLYSIVDLTDGSEVKIGGDVIFEFTLSEDEITTLESEEFESQQQAKLPKIKEAVEEDLEEDTFEERPPARKVREPKEQSAPRSSSGMSTLLFLILGLCALALGFYIRHNQDVLLPAKATAPVEDAVSEAPATESEKAAPAEPTVSE